VLILFKKNWSATAEAVLFQLNFSISSLHNGLLKLEAGASKVGFSSGALIGYTNIK